MRFKENQLLSREFHVKFHLKNRYRTHRFAIPAISVFRMKFNVEFPRQVMDFPIVFVLKIFPQALPIHLLLTGKLGILSA